MGCQIICIINCVSHVINMLLLLLFIIITFILMDCWKELFMYLMTFMYINDFLIFLIIWNSKRLVNWLTGQLHIFLFTYCETTDSENTTNVLCAQICVVNDGVAFFNRHENHNLKYDVKFTFHNLICIHTRRCHVIIQYNTAFALFIQI